MVRLLIRMRATMLGHQGSSRFGLASAVVAGLLGLVSAVGTLLLGFRHYPAPATGADVIAVVMAVWVVGRLAYAAFAGGESTLRFEIFRLLPIPRARLSRAILIVGLTDPSLLFMAVAFCALVALGAQYGAGPALLGALGVLLTLLMTSVLATIVGALMPAGSRRRQDLGTVLVAVAISLVAVAGTLLPALSSALTRGTAPGLSLAVRILPSGWAAVALDGAARGDAWAALLPLAGLIALTALLALAWPRLLSRRLDGRAGSRARLRARTAGRRLLPATPTGAVVAKELRLWLRDPIRVTLLLIAAIVGLGVCVVPEATSGTGILLPFTGAMTAAIAGAAGCNLYGGDGPSLRLTIMTPRSARPDVRGRQLAWLLLVAPYAVLVSVVLTLVGGQGWAWPLVLGVLPALLGGGFGLVPLASATAVQPVDDGGGLGPGWPVKVYAVLILLALTAAPPVALFVAGAASRSAWLEWLAVPAGVAVGAVLAICLGRLAVRRFEARQLDILAVLTKASNPA